MLKIPTMDICIESPKQNEFVNVVLNMNQNDHILGRGSFGRVYKAVYKGDFVCLSSHNSLLLIKFQVNQLPLKLLKS